MKIYPGGRLVIGGILEVPCLQIPLVWDWSMIARRQRLGTRPHSAHEDCWASYKAHRTQIIGPSSNRYLTAGYAMVLIIEEDVMAAFFTPVIVCEK
jgi:hypothetical protein